MSASDAPESALHTEEGLPPALGALWRTFSLGYRAEPKLLVQSLGFAMLMMVPDALLALWLKFLVSGITGHHRRTVIFGAFGLALSTTATWYLSVVSQRVGRRFRDRIAIAMESHVARLQAGVPTLEHHERPEYLDRLAMLRDQVFTLDHLFASLFSTLGWLFRLIITIALLVSIHPVLTLLALFTAPMLFTSTWRPTVERKVEEAAIRHQRLARSLFTLGTTAAPGKEVRVTQTGPWLAAERRASWQRWYEPVARTRWATAMWHSLSWAIFGGAYVAAVVYVASGLHRGVGDVVLVVVAGTRLANYVGATAGELGFLRGFWLDASRRLVWLEDYAKTAAAGADHVAPNALIDGITFDHVSFAYPGTNRIVLDDVNLHIPPGKVVAIVGENGAGKSTLVKLLARMYSPTSGRIVINQTDLAAIDIAEWRERLAGAFQDFYRYEFHTSQTVGVGDLPRLDDRRAVETAIERAGADDVVERLADGLDTQLGSSWDGGAEVSFGQWQKLALARGFMREDPLLLILDEPTAALDPETEHALFARYSDAARIAPANGRVTMLVSHRFSTVRMADLIIVMDGSRVAEYGTHDDLMAKRGQYAELHDIQAAAFTT